MLHSWGVWLEVTANNNATIEAVCRTYHIALSHATRAMPMQSTSSWLPKRNQFCISRDAASLLAVTLVVVMTTLCAAAASIAAPPPPPFPQQFTASYVRTDVGNGQVSNSTYGMIYQDERNQRCRMIAHGKLTAQNVEQLAIYQPPYAQRDTAPASLLTLFNYGPYGVPSKIFPALFSSRTAVTEFQNTYPFPAHWFDDHSSQPNVGACMPNASRDIANVSRQSLLTMRRHIHEYTHACIYGAGWSVLDRSRQHAVQRHGDHRRW
jgi:hypothetical protein